MLRFKYCTWLINNSVWAQQAEGSQQEEFITVNEGNEREEAVFIFGQGQSLQTKIKCRSAACPAGTMY